MNKINSLNGSQFLCLTLIALSATITGTSALGDSYPSEGTNDLWFAVYEKDSPLIPQKKGVTIEDTYIELGQYENILYGHEKGAKKYKVALKVNTLYSGMFTYILHQYLSEKNGRQNALKEEEIIKFSEMLRKKFDSKKHLVFGTDKELGEIPTAELKALTNRTVLEHLDYIARSPFAIDTKDELGRKIEGEVHQRARSLRNSTRNSTVALM